jgi:ERCC4-type nuclease
LTSSGRILAPIPITIDDREAGCGVADVLRELEGVVVQVQRLSLGDYLIDEGLVIERKTLVDLVASIKDGRLFQQGCRLARSPYWAALILEGTGRDLAGSGMRREAIQGALITLALFLGIPLLRSRDRRETARLMLFAARQARTVAAGVLPRRGRRPRGKYRVQTQVLQGLPGVGPERAKRLLDKFGTVEAVMAAASEELASVRGVGTATAEAIRWAVEEGASDYACNDHTIFPL